MVESGMQHCRERKAGQIGVGTLQQSEGSDGEDGGRAAVHDGRAEAAHEPGAKARVRRHRQVVEVLDQREAGADRQTEDRGVDEEADAVRADERDDHQRLQAFFDQRRAVARVEMEIEALEERAVDEIGDAGDRHAAEHRHHHPAQAHQLVAVEKHERPKEAKHRRKAEKRAHEIHHMILRETIHSSPVFAVPRRPAA